MKTGYIALYRKIQDHFLWKERRVFSRAEAWIDILWEVRWKPEPVQVVIKNKVLICNYAESLNSLDTWAARWNWSKARVKRVLSMFAECSMIELKNETVTTRIKVCNYEKYDTKRNASETEVKRERNASETEVKPEEEGKKVSIEEGKPSSPRSRKTVSKDKPKDRIKFDFDSEQWIGIVEKDVTRWAKANPSVDIQLQLNKALAWAVANPQKAKQDWNRFLTKWMGNAQEWGGDIKSNRPAPVQQQLANIKRI